MQKWFICSDDYFLINLNESFRVAYW